MKKIRDVVSKSLIVSYKEDINELENSLARSGLSPQVLRATYSSDELKFPSNTRTFMNHRNAWRIAAGSSGYTLICEADFVPCRNLANLPVFWPLDNPLAWGYLYQGSPRLLSIVGPERYLRGHCAPLVGYVVNKRVAGIMLQFFDYEMAKYGTAEYFGFDAHLQWWVMDHGGEAYIPARHYGEHGGVPNPEHARSPDVRGMGLHRADNLAGPLAFLPQYADGNRVKFMKQRLRARAFGYARLFFGRWIVDTHLYSRDWRKTLNMQWIGICRLLS